VRERYYVDALLSRRADGIIVSGRRSDPRPPLAGGTLPVPVVYAFAESTRPEDVSVIPDDLQGGRLAVEHLVEGGRRRLAHVTGPERFAQVRLRYQGARAAAADAGVEMPANRVLFGSWSEAWGYEAAARLRGQDPEIDAIFCGNDLIGRGMADGLRDLGVRVPDDVALVGYDNWEILSAGTRPPLTSVDMGLEGLGRKAAQLLLNLIEGEPVSGVQRLPCGLVVRASSTTDGSSAADRAAETGFLGGFG
jgi:LacI family transcriptional regulator